MMTLVYVALGGAIGSSARYLLGGLVHRYTPAYFPYGTFAVNILGCLLFGLIIGVAEPRTTLGPAARAFLLIGVLGGFTTFSSFTFETFALLRDAELTRAAVNAIGQLIIGLVALWAGYVAGRLV